MVTTCELAVIILTYNEEANVSQALESVCGWARQVFVVDSFSTDKTLSIVQAHPCSLYQHAFEDYSRQRNWALDHLPIKVEWILFLDADEWLPDSLRAEISSTIALRPEQNGFFLKRRLIWMGSWIRHGYYPTWILRLFRFGKARTEDRQVNEHLVAEGPVGHLKCDFMHEDRNGIGAWISKHNGYATREAAELCNQNAHHEIGVRLLGTQAERKRWLRYRIWNHMPPLFRPFVYFFYRYILTGGFLDGKAAFTYHFLQALWFPMLIDIKYLEMKSVNSITRLSGTSEGREDKAF